MRIYKILTQTDWQVLQEHGVSDGAPVDVADGHVHFSTEAQLAETLALHFAGQADLVLAALEADAHEDAIKWEASRGGQMFPHLYAPLRRDMLSDLGRIGWDGRAHTLPEGWRDV